MIEIEAQRLAGTDRGRTLFVKHGKGHREHGVISEVHHLPHQVRIVVSVNDRHQKYLTLRHSEVVGVKGKNQIEKSKETMDVAVD